MSDLNIYLASVAAFLGVILTLIRIMDYFFPQRKIVNQYPSSSNIKILQLRRRPSRDTLWNVTKVISIVISVLMLLFVGLLVYATIKSGLQLNFPSVLFLAFLTGLSANLLASVILDERKMRRRGRSRVAELAELELFGDCQSTVVEQCRRALSDMGARIILLDANYGAIEAELKRSKVTIQITKIEDMRHHVSIISDAMWPTVRIDFGQNRNIVDGLIKRL